MKRAQVTEAEAATLVQIVYDLLVEGDWPRTAGGGWRGGFTATRDFGGRELRVSFCDPLESANPLAIIYGNEKGQPGTYQHEWVMKFRVPKDFPAHPRLDSSDRSAEAIAKGTNIFDVEFEGDKAAYERDIVFVKMTL